MSVAKPDYRQLNASLDSAGLLVDAAEVDGLLGGLLCAGMAMDGKQWLPHLVDLINDGQSLPHEVDNLLSQLYHANCQQLIDAQLGFMPLLPGDDDSLEERLEALALWVQGFLAGVGLQQIPLEQASEQLQEALHDLAEIANVGLDSEAGDEDENESAYAELFEYVRVAGMLTFNEFGQAPTPGEADEPLH